jgi:chemotaxis regulatin CheY-phosphate phosphatase CheZ
VTIPSINAGAASDIVDIEYDALEAALMKTGRGRAFLHEYARRNRSADTQMVLTAIERLEGTMRAQDPIADVQRFRGDVLEMAGRIADTRQQLVAMREEQEEDTSLGRAKGELDAIVQATESATGNILEAAEEIQEIAWTLREGGFAIETCDAIDLRATNIYLACSFQDLTSQRIRKVIEAMQFLETRIIQMIDIWGFSEKELSTGLPVRTGLAGPTQDGLKQDEVDIAMVVHVPEHPSATTNFEAASDVPLPDPSVAMQGDWHMPLPMHADKTAVAAEPMAAEPQAIAEEMPTESAAAPVLHLVSEEDPDTAEAARAVDDELDLLAQKMAPLDTLTARRRIAEFE